MQSGKLIPPKPPTYLEIGAAIITLQQRHGISEQQARKWLLDALCEGVLQARIVDGYGATSPISEDDWKAIKYGDGFHPFRNIEILVPTLIEWLVSGLTNVAEQANSTIFAERAVASIGHPAQELASSRGPKKSEIEELYAKRVASWPPGIKTPSRDDDLMYFRELFPQDGLTAPKIITAQLVRELRSKHAPVAWTSPGTRSRKQSGRGSGS